MLYAGRLVEEGPVDDVFNDPRHPYAVGLLRCLPRGGVRKDQQRLDTIPGFLPQLGADLPACVFVDRCGLAQEICSKEEPPFHDLGGGRHSRCHFWEQAHELPRATPASAAFKPVDQSAEPVIRAESLNKTFRQEGNDIRAVDDLNFALRPGETLGLVGESGSGKTTLARTLLGLIPADEGSIIELDGVQLEKQITKRGRDDVRALQIVFQNPDSALNRRFSVQRILSRALEKLRGDSGGEREEHLRELAHSVRFDTRLIHSRPAQLSGGLKQRVAIARAFAGEPRVVVCDEPTSALDVSVQAAILNLLAELQAEKGVTYLFISHDLGVVRYLSDRIAVLYLGRLMELGDAETVFSAAAPSLHGGAAVLGPAGRRRGARADPAPRARSRGTATRRRAASSTPAARATSATSATSRSPSSRRSSPATSGAATTRSRSCARCRRARPSRPAGDPAARSREQAGAPPTRRALEPAAESRVRAAGRGSPSERPRRGRQRPGGRAAAGRGRALKVRAAVLERVGAPLEVTELDLAPPGPGEALVRLHASGVCHSDLNAIDGTAATRCPAVLGHEGAGVVEQVGEGVDLAPGTRVVLSWLPACGRCEECLRELGHLCTTAWDGMATGGLLDGTPRLSRAGEPVYHYSFLSVVRRAHRSGGRLLHPDPRRRPVRRRRAGRLRRGDGDRRRLAHRGRAARRPGRGDRMRRRRDERAARRRRRGRAARRGGRRRGRQARRRGGAGSDARGSLGGRARRRPRSACSRSRAAESTTRSRRRAARRPRWRRSSRRARAARRC